MAKASKVTQFTVSNDSAIIARDFATFGQFTANNDARTALLRRVSDAETFKTIRLAALAAWLVQKGYDADTARANIDGTLANPKAFGKGDKRTAEQQVDYKRAGAAWQYYLECNGVASLTRAKSDKPKAKRAPAMAGTKAAPLANNSAKVPQTIQSIVVTKANALIEAQAQFANGVAYLSRVAAINAKVLQGDKGSLLRDLAAHCQREMKRIEAMKD